MKNLKDYAHFYIGQDIDTGTGRVTLVGVHIDKINETSRMVVLNGNVTHTMDFDNCNLILRPLESITDEEAHGLPNQYISAKDFHIWYNHYNGHLKPAEVLALLNMGFDLFGLIEAGIALNKTKI